MPSPKTNKKNKKHKNNTFLPVKAIPLNHRENSGTMWYPWDVIFPMTKPRLVAFFYHGRFSPRLQNA